MKITGDAAQVKALLRWSKTEGIELSRITIGACTVDVVRAVPLIARKQPDAPPEHSPSLYERFAPDVMIRAIQDMGGEEYTPVLRSK
jgi:hypothetical protein